ncbi:MAG: GNAT family N-acetyltransferase [Candidatus Marinimicrobia bacterium]|nr:GNAT family N-acetyltransferase [Candidatus Neomarinimicrobiota bacterium]
MKQVRPWRRSDLPAIQQVAWTTWADAYGSFIPEEDRRDFHIAYYALDKLQILFDSKIVTGCVAVVDEKVVGYSKTHWNEKRAEFFITSLYVLPQFQKLKLGKDMLNFGIEAAKKHDADRVWLGVMIENTPAIEWYHRQGFVFIEKRPFTIGKTTIDDLIGYKLI